MQIGGVDLGIIVVYFNHPRIILCAFLHPILCGHPAGLP